MTLFVTVSVAAIVLWMPPPQSIQHPWLPVTLLSVMTATPPQFVQAIA